MCLSLFLFLFSLFSLSSLYLFLLAHSFYFYPFLKCLSSPTYQMRTVRDQQPSFVLDAILVQNGNLLKESRKVNDDAITKNADTLPRTYSVTPQSEEGREKYTQTTEFVHNTKETTKQQEKENEGKDEAEKGEGERAPFSLVMPHGMRWNAYFLSPTTTVWPALDPPLYRQHMSNLSATASTNFPLPSSPHCAPMMAVSLFVSVNAAMCSFFSLLQSERNDKKTKRQLTSQPSKREVDCSDIRYFATKY